MEKSRESYLFKNTAIFTLGNLASKVITFFLVPIYTNALSLTQYGVSDLCTVLQTVAVPVLTLNIAESVVRFNMDKNADHDQITKTGLVLLCYAIIFGLILIPVSNHISILSGLGVYLYFYCVTSASYQVLLSNLRGRELLVQYSFGNVLFTLMAALFNILLLLVFHMGIKGYLLAFILTNLCVTIYSFIVGKVHRALKAKLNKSNLITMLKYSCVLMPSSFTWWIINSSDHLMVTAMISAAANGIYAVAYKIPTFIATLAITFSQAWSYSAVREENAGDVSAYTNRVLKSMIGILMLVGLCMVTFIKPFIKIYVSAEYESSWKYAPFLTFGFVYLAMASFMGTIYTVHKDGKGHLFSSVLGAATNILLNLILIPVTGIYGAAVATCVSYFAIFLFRALNTKKYLTYHLLTREFIIGNIGLFISSVLIYCDGLPAQIIQILIFLIEIYLFRNVWLPLVKTIFGKCKARLHK